MLVGATVDKDGRMWLDTPIERDIEKEFRVDKANTAKLRAVWMATPAQSAREALLEWLPRLARKVRSNDDDRAEARRLDAFIRALAGKADPMSRCGEFEVTKELVYRLDVIADKDYHYERLHTVEVNPFYDGEGSRKIDDLSETDFADDRSSFSVTPVIVLTYSIDDEVFVAIDGKDGPTVLDCTTEDVMSFAEADVIIMDGRRDYFLSPHDCYRLESRHDKYRSLKLNADNDGESYDTALGFTLDDLFDDAEKIMQSWADAYMPPESQPLLPLKGVKRPKRETSKIKAYAQAAKERCSKDEEPFIVLKIDEAKELGVVMPRGHHPPPSSTASFKMVVSCLTMRPLVYEV